MRLHPTLLIILGVFACGEEEPPVRQPPPAPAPAPTPSAPRVEERVIPPLAADAIERGAVPEGGISSFIGGPCARDADCAFDGGRCLLDGFPSGTCSMSCDRLCPDAEGSPTTFCAEGTSLDGDAAELGGGACLSRCDYALYPGKGCREGYGCAPRARESEPGTVRSVCVPGVESEPTECLAALAALGIDFEPTELPDAHPEGHPELTCHVEEPVIIHPPVHGVGLVYYNGNPTPNVRASCEMARSLVRTIDDVKARGVVTLMHYGTYNCRTIAGTNSLSRHGMGDAIDIAGFIFSDGRRYTVLDDWEMGTNMPATPPGVFLYDAVHRWYQARLWSIILTPEFNAAHHNHFHVDLTPGSHTLHDLWNGYLGPAPYDD
jgi:hypothetical protein